MKAVILENLNQKLRIADVGLTELSYGQVLVKVLKSGLCGAQLQEIEGQKNNSKFLPHLLGHEGCGIVESIGLGVTKLSVGDKVIMHWRKGDGIESDFPKYILDNKKITSGKVTTLSEYSIVSENRLTPVPHDTPDNLCALLGCGLSTALGVINNDADVKFGQSVLVVGCGGVGLNLIQGASLASAYPIVGIDICETKKDLVLSLNADLFIDASKNNIESELEKVGLKKFDVIIDTTGNVQSINSMIQYLSDSGKFILVAQPKHDEVLKVENPQTLFLGNGKIIKASQGGQTSPTEDIPRYLKLYKKGKINIDKIITHEFDLDNINDAINLLKSGQAGRIMIKTC